MRKNVYDESWPEVWKSSYEWDQLELWGSRHDLGYSYQYGNRRYWTLHTMERLVPRGGAILDVAAASGNFTLPLAEQGYQVTWNDLRLEMMDVVKSKYEFGRVEFSPGNIFDFQDSWRHRFDGMIAAEVIEHVAHPDEFLTCLFEMLKPGGHLIITTPNGRYFKFNYPRFSECSNPEQYEAVQFKPDSDGHIFLLDRDECRDLASSVGFEVKEICVMNNPLTRGHIKLGNLLTILPKSLVMTVESATRALPTLIRDKLHCQMLIVLRKPMQ